MQHRRKVYYPVKKADVSPVFEKGNHNDKSMMGKHFTLSLKKFMSVSFIAK